MPRLFDRQQLDRRPGTPQVAWDKDDVAALASDSENAVAMLFAEIVNVGSNGLKDPQAEQAEQAHQREVERAARLPSCGQHCLELQVGQSERR